MVDDRVVPQAPVGGADPGAVARALAVLEPLGDRVAPDAELGSLTTYRVGGRARILVTAGSVADLAGVADAVGASHLDVLVVGRGSNLLVSDRGFEGIAVVLDPAGFSDIAVDGPLVRAGASVALPVLARQSVDAGLTGLEWAVGVPGSVGGGVRMNAGGHGSDMSRSLVSCELVDLRRRPGSPVEEARSLADLRYSYRHSSILPHQVVTAATFGLSPGDPEAGRATIRDIVRWRRDHQPGGQNAGSVFTNPPGDSAGRLIESVGLKGFRHQTAAVSAKHANFIQADPGGSAEDVYELIQLVRAQVSTVHGIDLLTEVRTVGFADQPSTGTKGFDSGEAGT